MAPASPLKVIIVGGSVSGLTLANCLEKAGIDYELLERGEEIVYNGGASIGLMPNGLRIMDQLDVFEAIRKTTEPLAATYHRTPDGVSYASSNYMHMLEEKHGYPSLFFEREELLQILYQRLTKPLSVHTGKKVTGIETSPTGVKVISSDGSIFEGDIVVGGDGVNSTVKRCMWKAMEPEYPELIAKESNALFAEYCCLFGISIMTKPVADFAPGTMHIIYDQKLAFGAIIGINKKVFWFIFIKMEKKYYAPNIPRFTKADSDRIAEEYKHRKLTPDCTFGDLWQARSKTTLVSLEEGVSTTWFNQRTVLVGDSVHKMTPNAGQGGNTAIESGVLLTNLLYRLRAEKGGSTLTTEDFETLFTEYQRLQIPRATTMFDASTILTRLQTKDTVALRILATHLIPILGDPFQINIASSLAIGGVKLEFVDKKLKEGKIPWEGWSPWTKASKTSIFLNELMNASYLILSWYGIRELSKRAASKEVLSKAVELISSKFFLDGSALQAPNFLVNVLPVVGIAMIESLRANNSTKLPLIAGFAYQLGGVPLSAVTYYLTFAISSLIKRRNIPGGNIVEPSYASTLASAILMVYPGISLLALAPGHLSHLVPLKIRALKNEIWQILPAFIAITNHILAKRVRKNKTLPQTREEIDGHGDLPSLRKTYLILTTIPALVHFYTSGSALLSANPVQAIKELVLPRGSWDYIATFGTGLLWAGWNFSKTSQWMGVKNHLKLTAIIAGITPLIGPGAVISALWGLREEALRAF